MKAIVGGFLLCVATLVWANCTTHSYYMNGRYVVCTTCCYGGNCNTSCY